MGDDSARADRREIAEQATTSADARSAVTDEAIRVSDEHGAEGLAVVNGTLDRVAGLLGQLIAVQTEANAQQTEAIAMAAQRAEANSAEAVTIQRKATVNRNLILGGFGIGIGAVLVVLVVVGVGVGKATSAAQSADESAAASKIAADRATETIAVIRDCTVEGGDCFDDGQARSAEFIAQLLVGSWCGPRSLTPAATFACVRKAAADAAPPAPITAPNPPAGHSRDRP
jgi:hypothetical protein